MPYTQRVYYFRFLSHWWYENITKAKRVLCLFPKRSSYSYRIKTCPRLLLFPKWNKSSTMKARELIIGESHIGNHMLSFHQLCVLFPRNVKCCWLLLFLPLAVVFKRPTCILWKAHTKLQALIIWRTRIIVAGPNRSIYLHVKLYWVNIQGRFKEDCGHQYCHESASLSSWCDIMRKHTTLSTRFKCLVVF